jgi:hypothetical protein
MGPRGTVDIHTYNEPETPYASEQQGTRMSIVSLDDDTVTHSFEAIDFNVDSWIRIYKDGDIKLHSLSDASYIDILGTSSTVDIYGTDVVNILASSNIDNTAPTILENCGSHIITGFCSHGGCSCSSSDERLKTNVTNLEYGLDAIKELTPISFEFKKSDDLKHLGFIAQDVQQIIPEVVQTQSDNMLGIRYDELIPVLVNAVKELTEKVETLEMKLQEHGIQ